MAAPAANTPRSPGASKTGMPLIRLAGVSLAYGRQVILRDVNLEIQPGEFLGIVGPNGAGKTSILRGLLGFLRPARGTIERAAWRCGYVPQRQTIDDLFPLTVREVAVMGRFGRLGLIRRPGRADWQAVRECLAAVGLAGLEHRLLRELSAGQKQRALLARALAGEPDLLALDEPTSDMDPAGARAVLELLRDLHRQHAAPRPLTVVMVSHDVQEMVNFAQRLCFVSEGTVETVDTAAVGPEFLCRLYGMPVEVLEREGRKVILR